MYPRPSKTVMGTGLGRNCQLLIPNGYVDSDPVPLIVFLHNYAATGLDVQGRLTMDQCMNFDNGSLVLVPNGTVDLDGNTFWNASPACCDKHSAGPDDKGYIVSIVNETIAAGWNVDKSRIWIKAYSNGAFLAFALACHHPELFTAVVGVAGAFDTLDGSGCAGTKNVNVLVIHADGDTTVPFNGGLGNAPVSQQIPITGVPSAAQTASYFAALNGIAGNGLVSRGANVDYITTGSPGGTGAETVRQEYASPPADGHVGYDVMQGAFHTMVFSRTTFAGQKLWAWAYPKPRVS